MNKQQSKYFQTAAKMDEAFLELLEKKDFEYITVKEICAHAGVNRSTFYLHYETIAQLLEESVSYVNERFRAHMEQSNTEIPQIESCPVSDLNFMTPQYLLPYLEFIRQNRRVFATMIKRAGTLQLDKSYRKLARYVLVPILTRFGVEEGAREYMLAFYTHGLMSIITHWIETGCAEEIENIASIMQRCVMANMEFNCWQSCVAQ